MDLQEQIDFQVASVLLEIRTGFNWKEFKSIDKVEDPVQRHQRRQDYAQKHLKMVGRGSSRESYILSNRYVLKLVRPNNYKFGTEQNEVEVRIATDPATQAVVTEIYDFQPNYEWIVSELVRPFKETRAGENEFESLTGIDFDMFSTLIYTLEDMSPERAIENIRSNAENFKRWAAESEKRYLEFKDKPGRIPQHKAKLAKQAMEDDLAMVADYHKRIELLSHPLVVATVDLVKKHIKPGDAVRLDHWGKTANGRVVLLDYGFQHGAIPRSKNTVDSAAYTEALKLEHGLMLLEVRTGFDIRLFKDMSSLREQYAYASDKLTKLGEGSTRHAFLLSNRHVLKIADPRNDNRGRGQNEAEVEAFTDPAMRPVLAKIFDFDSEEFNWLISELVRPLSRKEFFEHIGIDNSGTLTLAIDFYYKANEDVEEAKELVQAELEKLEREWADSVVEVKEAEEDPETEEHFLSFIRRKPESIQRKIGWYENALKALDTKFLQTLFELSDEFEILLGDTQRHDHWGKTADGRVVLLDYGYTESVIYRYY